MHTAVSAWLVGHVADVACRIHGYGLQWPVALVILGRRPVSQQSDPIHNMSKAGSASACSQAHKRARRHEYVDIVKQHCYERSAMPDLRYSCTEFFPDFANLSNLQKENFPIMAAAASSDLNHHRVATQHCIENDQLTADQPCNQASLQCHMGFHTALLNVLHTRGSLQHQSSRRL